MHPILDSKVMRRSPTMSDVAQEAGVSKNAVSLALRNDPQIPQATRVRIAAIADRMGYKRNPVVSELMARLRQSGRSTKRDTIALINAHARADAFSKHPTIPVYVEGCRRRAAALGYATDDFWLADPKLGADRLRDILVARGIRGAVLIGLMDSSRMPEKLLPTIARLPVVVTGVRTTEPPLDFACVDHHFLALRAACEAWSLGYRRIGLALDGRLDALVDGRFSAGFLLAQQQFPRAARLAIHRTDRGDGKAKDHFIDWVRRVQPDAVLSLFTTPLTWLRSGGFRVPGDVGFALLEWRAASPQIAGMNQHNEETGASAVDRLVSLIHQGTSGAPDFPRATLVGPQWVSGASLPPR